MAGPSAPVLGGGTVALDADRFDLPPNVPLLHEVVKAELAARRQGTHETRTRGHVAGGAAKPWRQKGTGRARQGTTRAPQWKGGGVVFGPHPKSYDLKVNRKAARKARDIALSQHVRHGSLGVFDGGAFEAPGTKAALALVAGWREERPLLVVPTLDESAAALSFRNVDRCAVLAPHEVGVADLLWARSLLVSRAAIAELMGVESA
jgi:large subunit ribosomal protein L4